MRQRVAGQAAGRRAAAATRTCDASPTRIAAEQGLRVVGDDELRVASRSTGLLTVTSSAPGVVGQRVAEAGDVDAEQLELGRSVGAGEDSAAPPSQPVGDDLGHRVAGCDQPVGHAVDAGALADRVDVLVTGPAGRRPRRRRRAARRQARSSRASSSRGRMPAENTTRSRSSSMPSAKVASIRGAVPRRCRRTDVPSVHRHVKVGDQLPQQGAAALVHLQRHQPRRELDHVRRHAEQPQRAGRFEAEQPAADDQPGPPAARRRGGAPGGGRDGVQVVEGAVDEAAGQIRAGHRRHERVRSRWQGRARRSRAVARGWW